MKPVNWEKPMQVKFLQENQYKIEATNWRYKRAEVDIIAFSPEGILSFVEVKTRKNLSFGPPESFVTEKKERLLVDLASSYMEMTKYGGEIRFDIIAVYINIRQGAVIKHFKDAFFPGLE